MADDKQIIIDEDWKEQVRAEKEASKATTSADSPEATAAGAEPSREPPPSEGQLPAATLTSLCSMLATQAMAALGLFAAPGAPSQPDLAQAKYFVDLVTMLDEKTQGNRTAEEIAMLSSLMHELRMMVVAAKK